MLTDEVKAKLAALALVPSGYEVRRGRMPPSPDRVIVLYETGGTAESRAFTGTPVEQPGLMVVVRGPSDQDYDGPRLVIERIHRALCDLGAFTVSGVRYLGFTPLQAPFPRGGLDGNSRQEFGVNYLVQKEPSPTT